LTPTYPAKAYTIGLASDDVRFRLLCGAERVFALAALLALLPLLVVIAGLVCFLSRRGPLVRHSRVGWRGAPLAVFKFRTMWRNDAQSTEFRFVETVVGAPVAAKRGPDARVTSRFATFCRRYSLDELPQLFHVVRGEMSLVGPRPLTREELDAYYGESSEELLSIRPGMTGLWQVRGRNRLSYARRRRLDLILVRRASVSLYFRILSLSLPIVLKGDDAW